MLKYWPIGLAAIVATAAILAGLSSSTDPLAAWQMASRMTAQVGFPFLIITYSASSLVKLRSSDLTRSLMKNRKYWGLSFAMTHTFHLVALLSVLRIQPDPVDILRLIPGALVYVILYAMVLTSNQWGYRTLGKNWKRLHSVGIHLFWLIFAASYISKVSDPEHIPIAGIYSAVAILALLLRIAAWRKSHRQRKSA
jgi:DMSO/TMAO reductase YedYZ heme-binding membrane subunit